MFSDVRDRLEVKVILGTLCFTDENGKDKNALQ